MWRFDGTKLTPEGHVLPLEGGGHVAFSPDGKLMAAVSWSAAANPVAIYDVPAFTLRQMLTGTTDFTVDVGFTPDSQHVRAPVGQPGERLVPGPLVRQRQPRTRSRSTTFPRSRCARC